MRKWIENAEYCGFPQFGKCAAAMQNWYTGIVNSLSMPITNGFTEECNNKIKVSKNDYGCRNFRRFSDRILHMFSCPQIIKKQAITFPQLPACTFQFFTPTIDKEPIFSMSFQNYKNGHRLSLLKLNAIAPFGYFMTFYLLIIHRNISSKDPQSPRRVLPRL